MRAGRCLLLLPLLLLQTGCEEPTLDNALPPMEVTVSVADTRRHEVTVTVAGAVMPDRRASIASRLSGAVDSLHVEAGDEVTAGELLLELDDRDVAAEVASARRALDSAESAWRQAERELDRMRRLHERELVARVSLEEAEVAEAHARAETTRAQARLAASEANLDYARLRAPFAGMVSEVLAEEGGFVGPGMPVIIIEDRQRLQAEALIDAHTASRLRAGDRLESEIPALRTVISGRLQALLPALGDDAPAAGLRLRIVFEPPPQGLAPGMVVHVRVPRGDPPLDMVVVPREALLQRGQLTGVFVAQAMDEQRVAQLRWIRLADGVAPGDNLVAVRHGLEPGAWVVVGEAVEQLQDGQPLTVTAEQSF